MSLVLGGVWGFVRVLLYPKTRGGLCQVHKHVYDRGTSLGTILTISNTKPGRSIHSNSRSIPGFSLLKGAFACNSHILCWWQKVLLGTHNRCAREVVKSMGETNGNDGLLRVRGGRKRGSDWASDSSSSQRGGRPRRGTGGDETGAVGNSGRSAAGVTGREERQQSQSNPAPNQIELRVQERDSNGSCQQRLIGRVLLQRFQVNAKEESYSVNNFIRKVIYPKKKVIFDTSEHCLGSAFATTIIRHVLYANDGLYKLEKSSLTETERTSLEAQFWQRNEKGAVTVLKSKTNAAFRDFMKKFKSKKGGKGSVGMGGVTDCL